MNKEIEKLVKECIRIWKVAYKPSLNEVKEALKVTFIITFILGFIGMLIQLLRDIIFRI